MENETSDAKVPIIERHKEIDLSTLYAAAKGEPPLVMD